MISALRRFTAASAARGRCQGRTPRCARAPGCGRPVLAVGPRRRYISLDISRNERPSRHACVVRIGRRRQPEGRAPKPTEPWPVNSSITCRVCPRPIRATERCWITSICVLSGRQDRRARRQRRRQVDAAAHHGRHRHRIYRRRPGSPRAPASATWRRSRSSIRPNRSAKTSWKASPPQKAILDRYNELAIELFRRDRRRNDQAAGRDRGQGPVGSRLQGRSGDGRVALPAGRRRCRKTLGRRAPPRGAVPAAARTARTAAARRTDQPSRRRVGDLARRPSAQLSGRDPDRHPRPLFPRQRHRLDSRTRSRPRHSLRGQLFVVAACRSRSDWSRKAARTRRASARLQREQEWIRPRRARARPNRRRATSATRNCSRTPSEKQTQTAQIVIPVAERLGQNVVDFEQSEERLRRQSADRRSDVQAAARRHRRRHRARTAPARPRCSA